MVKFNSVSVAASLAKHFKAGDTARATLDAAVEAINNQVKATREHIKETKTTAAEFFKGNARTNAFRAAMTDEFKKAGIADKTARNYIGLFITCVTDNKTFKFGMANGTDKKKAGQGNTPTQGNGNEPTQGNGNEPNKAPTVGGSNVVHVPVSEDGNNGADVRQAPNTKPHEVALASLAGMKTHAQSLFLVFGTINMKSNQAAITAIVEEIERMAGEVREALK